MRILLILALLFIVSGCAATNINSHDRSDYFSLKQQEYESHIGKTYWVSKAKPLNILRKPDKYDLGIETQGNTSFKVVNILKVKYQPYPFYYIETDNGIKGYLDVNDLMYKLESKAILVENPIILENKNLSELESMGIKRGNTLWLKYPNGPFGGLSKLTILDINIIEKQINLKVTNDHVTDYIIFYNVNLLQEETYNSEPVTGWSQEVIEKIKSKKINIGMTREQVVAAWGKPSNVNRTVGQFGIHEQWIYGKTYLYFEDDTLNAFQDSK